MIQELRWVTGAYGNMVLEAYDGHVWFPVTIGGGPWQGEVPGFKRDSVVTTEVHHKAVYGEKQQCQE